MIIYLSGCGTNFQGVPEQVLPPHEAVVMFSCNEFAAAKWKPTGRYKRVHEARILAMAFGKHKPERKKQ